MLFDPFSINGVAFKNRIFRSSLGGRMAFYDGTVSPAFKSFETQFARGGVGAIITATVSVNKRRMSPLEYPALHDDRYIEPLKDAVRAVRALDCRYIIQIGDPGGHTHTGVFSEDQDARSASRSFNLLYGYRNRTIPMTEAEIDASVQEFGSAARRVRQTGADGVEITASKGYLIHQFLNPATNRRTDAYGGSLDKRFLFLERIIRAAREEAGKDFLLGVRLSAQDYNYLPLSIRFPIVFPLRDFFMGNTLKETLYYGKKLKSLGVDYLHIDSGFGFVNPKGSPGSFPDEGIKLFYNATRHLSAKAAVRSVIADALPGFLLRLIMGYGWKFKPAANADFAALFRKTVGLPVIANGGFQAKTVIEAALADEKCDAVAIARPLLANPNLVQLFQEGVNEPSNPCSFCSECCARTAVLPLGCYDRRRFKSQDEMADQIMALSSPANPTI